MTLATPDTAWRLGSAAVVLAFVYSLAGTPQSR